MSLTPHFHPLSSFCWKALIALYENDIVFTPNTVNLGDRVADCAAATARFYGNRVEPFGEANAPISNGPMFPKES